MMKKIALAFLTSAIFASCSPVSDEALEEEALPSVKEAVGECAISDADAAWIDQAMVNWTFARHEIVDAPELAYVEAVFFSENCQLNNKSIMTSGAKTPWRITSHGGAVKLPDGDEMPPVVTSFSSGANGAGFFVMSTPSVWRAGGVESAMGLEVLMHAVMLHEGSHVLQLTSYGVMIDGLVEKHGLSDDFNDDSLQDLFEDNEDYGAGVKAETDLFIKAAKAETNDEAKTLAREALGYMEQRRNEWLVGEYAKYRYANDVWLTLEGSGQWVGYAWLTHPEGAGVGVQTAIDEWGVRSRFWTQNEGFAMALALDRLSDDWRQIAFSDGGDTLTAMLERASAA